MGMVEGFASSEKKVWFYGEKSGYEIVGCVHFRDLDGDNGARSFR